MSTLRPTPTAYGWVHCIERNRIEKEKGVQYAAREGWLIDDYIEIEEKK
jgi:hypothetical protein